MLVYGTFRGQSSALRVISWTPSSLYFVTGLSLRPVAHNFGRTPLNPSYPLSPPPSVLGVEMYMGAGDWTLGFLLILQAHYQLSQPPNSLKMYLWRCPQVAIGALFCLFSPFLGALFPMFSQCCHCWWQGFRYPQLTLFQHCSMLTVFEKLSTASMGVK